MRIAILVLMLVLLPLRGWAGTTMAVEHAPGFASALAQEAPCHESASPDPAPPAGGAHVCGLCDVCHNQLLELAVALPATSLLQHTRHPPPRDRFASAPARQSLKPPKT